MIKILKYTEYLYLIVSIIASYKAISDWNVDRNHAYLFIFFAVASIGMFLFRRKYRRKFEKRKQDNQ